MQLQIHVSDFTLNRESPNALASLTDWKRKSRLRGIAVRSGTEIAGRVRKSRLSHQNLARVTGLTNCELPGGIGHENLGTRR